MIEFKELNKEIIKSFIPFFETIEYYLTDGFILGTSKNEFYIKYEDTRRFIASKNEELIERFLDLLIESDVYKIVFKIKYEKEMEVLIKGKKKWKILELQKVGEQKLENGLNLKQVWTKQQEKNTN